MLSECPKAPTHTEKLAEAATVILRWVPMDQGLLVWKAGYSCALLPPLEDKAVGTEE